MSDQTFEPGALVKLKSGGPVMTFSHTEYMSDNAVCDYFDGTTHKQIKVPSTSLKAADEDISGAA
ncbi:DUF2158 domain-containing protein [uncultured Agrobacterium sp.]|uniref:DUF2158 domain-containing protein n=1 Tax=uncultured Agrobacterium sp. TaxID=157277 RepID=UPI00258684B3|nr:DUF2158 domain-containing protein [uncultured Agrobacterium sp.]